MLSRHRDIHVWVCTGPTTTSKSFALETALKKLNRHMVVTIGSQSEQAGNSGSGKREMCIVAEHETNNMASEAKGAPSHNQRKMEMEFHYVTRERQVKDASGKFKTVQYVTSTRTTMFMILNTPVGSMNKPITARGILVRYDARSVRSSTPNVSSSGDATFQAIHRLMLVMGMLISSCVIPAPDNSILTMIDDVVESTRSSCFDRAISNACSFVSNFTSWLMQNTEAKSDTREDSNNENNGRPEQQEGGPSSFFTKKAKGYAGVAGMQQRHIDEMPRPTVRNALSTIDRGPPLKGVNTPSDTVITCIHDITALSEQPPCSRRANMLAFATSEITMMRVLSAVFGRFAAFFSVLSTQEKMLLVSSMSISTAADVIRAVATATPCDLTIDFFAVKYLNQQIRALCAYRAWNALVMELGARCYGVAPAQRSKYCFSTCAMTRSPNVSIITPEEVYSALGVGTPAATSRRIFKKLASMRTAVSMDHFTEQPWTRWLIGLGMWFYSRFQTTICGVNHPSEFQPSDSHHTGEYTAPFRQTSCLIEMHEIRNSEVINAFSIWAIVEHFLFVMDDATVSFDLQSTGVGVGSGASDSHGDRGADWRLFAQVPPMTSDTIPTMMSAFCNHELMEPNRLILCGQCLRWNTPASVNVLSRYGGCSDAQRELKYLDVTSSPPRSLFFYPSDGVSESSIETDFRRCLWRLFDTTARTSIPYPVYQSHTNRYDVMGYFEELQRLTHPLYTMPVSLTLTSILSSVGFFVTSKILAYKGSCCLWFLNNSGLMSDVPTVGFMQPVIDRIKSHPCSSQPFNQTAVSMSHGCTFFTTEEVEASKTAVPEDILVAVANSIPTFSRVSGDGFAEAVASDCKTAYDVRRKVRDAVHPEFVALRDTVIRKCVTTWLTCELSSRITELYNAKTRAGAITNALKRFMFDCDEVALWDVLYVHAGSMRTSRAGTDGVRLVDMRNAMVLNPASVIADESRIHVATAVVQHGNTESKAVNEAAHVNSLIDEITRESIQSMDALAPDAIPREPDIDDRHSYHQSTAATELTRISVQTSRLFSERRISALNRLRSSDSNHATSGDARSSRESVIDQAEVDDILFRPVIAVDTDEDVPGSSNSDGSCHRPPSVCDPLGNRDPPRQRASPSTSSNGADPHPVQNRRGAKRRLNKGPRPGKARKSRTPTHPMLDVDREGVSASPSPSSSPSPVVTQSDNPHCDTNGGVTQLRSLSGDALEERLFQLSQTGGDGSLSALFHFES